mmetsp:Transcript_18290/g.29162  ORF Transcript_18290/g.29162 Transcript_18290/m.29162 type:complete len:234 (+) Transcript_18290:3600-4301(+)
MANTRTTNPTTDWSGPNVYSLPATTMRTPPSDSSNQPAPSASAATATMKTIIFTKDQIMNGPLKMPTGVPPMRWPPKRHHDAIAPVQSMSPWRLVLVWAGFRPLPMRPLNGPRVPQPRSAKVPRQGLTLRAVQPTARPVAVAGTHRGHCCPLPCRVRRTKRHGPHPVSRPAKQPAPEHHPPPRPSMPAVCRSHPIAPDRQAPLQKVRRCPPPIGCGSSPRAPVWLLLPLVRHL